jgi:nucleoside diphosphate kinase
MANSAERRKQIADANRKLREELKKQFTGGSALFYMSLETKQAINDYKELMGYSNLGYAVNDLVRLGLNSIEKSSKNAIQKKLKGI